MSLLINESYANTAQPLWLGASGGVIDGNITADEVITGRLNTTRQIGIGSHAFSDANGNTQAGLLLTGAGTTVPPANDLMIGVANGQKIRFNQVGNDGFNTFLLPSAPGANQDNLTVGGVGAIRQLKLLDAGPAAVMGTETLVAGNSPVINTSVMLGPQTYVFLTRTDVNASTSLGELRVRQRNVGSFLVESDNPATPGVADPGDVSSFVWMIINPV